MRIFTPVRRHSTAVSWIVVAVGIAFAIWRRADAIDFAAGCLIATAGLWDRLATYRRNAGAARLAQLGQEIEG